MKKLNVKKLSVAIRQTLEDLGACEKDERYEINMGTWHTPYQWAKCEVCFSGSAMAKRLRAPFRSIAYPIDFPREEEMLNALNRVRRGKIFAALSVLNQNLPNELRRYGIEPQCVNWLLINVYADDPGKFKRSLSRVAGMLERRGL